MTVTLNQLSDFKYKVVEGEYFLELGAGFEDINITNVWHKMTGSISESSATLTIDVVNPAPTENNFRYRIESPYELIDNKNQPFFNLVIQNNKKKSPTLYAFIGSEDEEITRISNANSFIAINDLAEIYFTVENNTFKFYYQPIT